MQTPEQPPASPAVDVAPDRATALRFLFLALISLCVTGGWLALSPELLLAKDPGPATWGLLFVLIGGCFFSLAFAAFYAVAPRVYQSRMFCSWMAHAHFAVHLACVILVPGLMVAAGGEWLKHTWFVFFALPLLFVLPVFVVMQNGRGQSAVTAFFNAAAFWLLAAFVVAICVTGGWVPKHFQTARWIAAGFVLLFAGVFVNLIHGALLGCVSAGKPAPIVTVRVATGLVLSNLCVALLFHAVAMGPREVIALFAAVYCLGVLWFDAVVWSLLQEGEGRSAEAGVKMLLISSWMVVPAAVVGVAAFWGTELGSALLVNSYVVTAVLGVVALFAIGAFDLLFPDVVASGAGSTGSVLGPQIQIAGYVNSAVGVLVIIPGIWIGSDKVVSLGAFLFLMGLVALVAHAVWQVRGRSSAPAAAVS